MTDLPCWHFDFWGALRVRLEGAPRSSGVKGYRRKFGHYQVQVPAGEPDVIFEVKPFTADLPHAMVFNRYQIAEGRLARTHQYKLAKWQTDVAGLTGKSWHMRLWGNRASGVMMPHLTMTAWTQLALAVRGWVPVHAAAVVKGRGGQARGVVIAGRRGVGKTTLVGRLLDDGWQVVSEDRVYIKHGQVRGLRVPVNMKYDRADPGLAWLPRKTRWRLARNRLIDLATRGYIGLHEPVDMALLLPGRLTETCPLHRMVYLQSGGELAIDQAPDAQVFAGRMIGGNAFEDPGIIEDVLAYQYCFASFAGASGYLWSHDRDRLADELSRRGVELGALVVPVSPSEAEWDRVLGEVR